MGKTIKGRDVTDIVLHKLYWHLTRSHVPLCKKLWFEYTLWLSLSPFHLFLVLVLAFWGFYLIFETYGNSIENQVMNLSDKNCHKLYSFVCTNILSFNLHIEKSSHEELVRRLQLVCGVLTFRIQLSLSPVKWIDSKSYLCLIFGQDSIWTRKM